MEEGCVATGLRGLNEEVHGLPEERGGERERRGRERRGRERRERERARAGVRALLGNKVHNEETQRDGGEAHG